MQNDGESGQLLHNGIEHVESQWRRHELAGLRVACALFGLELVGTVAGTDRDGKAIYARLRHEVDHLFGLCVVTLFGHHLIFHASQYAKLTLYGDVELVSIFHHFLGQGYILVVRQRRAINHDAGEAHVHTALAQLEAVAVVEVQTNLRMVAA